MRDQNIEMNDAFRLIGYSLPFGTFALKLTNFNKQYVYSNTVQV